MTASSTERLPGFPAKRLLALVDSQDQVEQALTAVRPHVDTSTVRVLSGASGIRALDVTGAGRGLRGRLARVLQDLAFDRSSLATHDAHLRTGGHLLLVPARKPAECDRLVELLAACGAHGLLWFARASVVDVAPRRRAATTPAVLVTAPGRPAGGSGTVRAVPARIEVPRQRQSSDQSRPAAAVA